MSVAEIEQMTITERLEAMENLWASISYNDSEVKSPEWHKKVLTSRKEYIHSGKATFYNLDEVKSHFSK